MILCLGNVICTWRKVALSLSLDSLTAASGSHMISMLGSALLASASTVISYPCRPRFVKVLVLKILVIGLYGK